MNIEDLKNKLKTAIEENKDNIKQLENKIDILRDNRVISEKNIIALLISMLAYTVMNVLTASTASLFPIFVNIAPELCLLVGVSSGIISSKLLGKKFKVKEKLSQFSEAKKGYDLLEESAEYELQKGKLLTRNKILKNVIANLESRETLNNVLNQTGYVEQNLSKEQLEKNINIIERIIQQKLNDLDILVTKDFIDTRFYMHKDIKTTFRVFSGILFAIIFPFVYGLPDLTVGSPISFVRLFISSISGSVVGVKMMDKICETHTKLYDKYNKQLGEPSENIDEKTLINEISNMMAISENMKLDLSKIESKQTSPKEESLSKNNICQQSNILENNNETEEKKENGPRLVKRKK